MDDQNKYLTHLGSNMSETDLSNKIVNEILDNER